MAEYDFLYTGVSKKHKVTCLLDGDIVAVRSAAIFESQDGHEMSHLKMLVHKTINDWVSSCGADGFKMCLSLGRSFRYDAYPEYKSNRKQPKPRGTDEAKQYLRDKYPIWEYDTLEADDVMGIMATEPQDEEIRVIVSTDKDMLQIPAWQFNPDRDRWPHKPHPEVAEMFLKYQWTCGDSGDGYTGIPKFGVSRFKKAMQEDPDTLVIDLYEKNLLGDDKYALYDSQEVCAKILQWDNRPKDWRS